MLKKKKIYLYYIYIYIFFFQISAKFSNSSLFTWEVTRLIQVSSMIFHINIINVYCCLFTWEVTRLIQVSSMIFHINIINVYCCYEYFLLVSTLISWDNRIYFNDLGNYRRDGVFFPFCFILYFWGWGKGWSNEDISSPMHTHTGWTCENHVELVPLGNSQTKDLCFMRHGSQQNLLNPWYSSFRLMQSYGQAGNFLLVWMIR